MPSAAPHHENCSGSDGDVIFACNTCRDPIKTSWAIKYLSIDRTTNNVYENDAFGNTVNIHQSAVKSVRPVLPALRRIPIVS